MSSQRIERALQAIGRGELVVVADDEDRENEGDVIGAAGLVTPQSIGFMVRYTSGVICTALTPQRLDELELPLMVQNPTDPHQTAFTITVDLQGSTTGISAAERAATIRALGEPSYRAADFRRPGHVFPLRANAAGVLGRRGHTEAAVDLARLSGATPAGVLSEVVHDDGSMMRGPALEHFAACHGLVFLTIDDLVAYRMRARRTGRGVGRLASTVDSNNPSTEAIG